MKWGRRSGTNTSVKVNRSEKKQNKIDQKQLKKEQKKWDKNYKKNNHIAYNNASKEINDKLIPELNKKYAKDDFSNLKDPKVKQRYDKYISEYNVGVNDIMKRSYKEMFGERPK